MDEMKKLQVGQMVTCPRDGQQEKVLRVERRPGGRLFVRTSRHDHNWRER